MNIFKNAITGEEKPLLFCCICNRGIYPDGTGYSQGHSAQPIHDGRCCTECNTTVVIPARLRSLDKPADELPDNDVMYGESPDW